MKDQQEKKPQGESEYSTEEKSKKKLSEEELRKKHEEWMKRYHSSHEYFKELRDQFRRDHEFCDTPGAQWEGSKWSDDYTKLEDNQIKHARNIMLGMFRQNRFAPKVSPAKGRASKELADVHNGLLRNRLNDAQAETAMDNAFFEGATGGFGTLQLSTRHDPVDPWVQEYCLKPIYDAASSVWPDPGAIDENHSDMEWCIVTSEISKTKFKGNWPSAAVDGFEGLYEGSYGCGDWQKGSNLRIADCYENEYYDGEVVKVVFVDPQSGEPMPYEVYDAEKWDMIRDEYAQIAEFKEERRKARRCRILHWKVSGGEILQGPNLFPGETIPVFPWYGMMTRAGGKLDAWGIVRNAMDGQRFRNSVISMMADKCGDSTAFRFFATDTQIKGYENDWANANRRKIMALKYNVDPDVEGPPRPASPPQIDNNLIIMMRESDMIIKNGTGMYSQSLGDNPSAQSGIAIRAQQNQGDTGIATYFDNFNKLLKRVCDACIALNPIIYDTERQVKVMKEDGASEMVFINKTIRDKQTGRDVRINDLSQGKYEVLADTGPSFSSRREEALSTFSQMASSDPIFQRILGPKMVKWSNAPYGDEIEEQLDYINLKQGLREPTPEEMEKMPKPSPEQQKMAMIQLEEMVSKVERMKVEIDGEELANEKTRSEIAKNWAEVNKTIRETPINDAQAMIAAQKSLVELDRQVDEARRDAEYGDTQQQKFASGA